MTSNFTLGSLLPSLGCNKHSTSNVMVEYNSSVLEDIAAWDVALLMELQLQITLLLFAKGAVVANELAFLYHALSLNLGIKGL